MAETADELFRRLYECSDPDCTATHVDMNDLDLTRAQFTEVFDAVPPG